MSQTGLIDHLQFGRGGRAEFGHIEGARSGHRRLFLRSEAYPEMIYTDVLSRGGHGVQGPADRLLAGRPGAR